MVSTLFSKTINGIKSLFANFQFKQVFSIVLIGILVLATSLDSTIESGSSGNNVTRRLDKVLQQNETDRPQTTGEWNKEARQTEDAPGKRVERIAKESAEAVKQFGSVYPDTAKRSSNDLQNNHQ